MILCVETTSLNCSVALCNESGRIDLLEHREKGYTHAEKLHVFIDEILKRNQITSKDLQAIAVSMGPGSYTGLRIGVSSVKGLCYALNIPLMAISTLEMLLSAVAVEEVYSQIIPMIDARRMEVYMQVFSNERAAKTEVEANILDATYFENLPSNTLVLGEGADKFKSLLPTSVKLQEGVFPSASMMVQLALSKFQKKQFEDVAYFEPFYLKEFIAGTPKAIK
ncbi:MAG: tRNA (adenosine(37)-N6)-threonylcarbamoyltransferase complex dimerization subunit type 1 TsaB [Flavobacteriales bacterium]